MVVHSGARQDGYSRDISEISFRVAHADGFVRATRKEIPERCRTKMPIGTLVFRDYCKASIRRVMVRFKSLSLRRSSSILLMEWSTVV
jgi:hypothetical protein